MSKVNLKIKCSDLDIFGNSDCPDTIFISEVEDDDVSSATKKFKEKVREHFYSQYHKNDSRFGNADELSKFLDNNERVIKDTLYSDKTQKEKISNY